MDTNFDFGLCICTYKRKQLLKLLIEDSLKQSELPKVIIIIDGDPNSNEIIPLLNNINWPKMMSVIYAPSNHGNQTYQRYLGWRIAITKKVFGLLYLDDDLRTADVDSFKNMLLPIFNAVTNVVAVTGNLEMGKSKNVEKDNQISLDEFRKGLNKNNFFMKLFGSSNRYQPGQLTPSGNRIPLTNQIEPYIRVDWLRGGAMAFRTSELSEKIFSDDIFAMNHLRYGLCEDLIISRRLMNSGKLLFSNLAIFLHPNEDPPKAYSSKSFQFGIAYSYSRRWLNDNYRGLNNPKFTDRVALIKSFIGGLIIHWYKAIKDLNKQKILFAGGYTKGVLLAIFKKPTSKNLTPHINWWQDAEEALKNQIIIQ